MYGAAAGSKDTTALLIKSGANVNAKDIGGRTALMATATKSNLSSSYAERLKDVAELLIKSGVEVNAKDNEGMTALMLAARWGNKDTVELLIKSGANVNAKDNEGYSALMHAGSDDIANLLRAAGARE